MPFLIIAKTILIYRHNHLKDIIKIKYQKTNIKIINKTDKDNNHKIINPNNNNHNNSNNNNNSNRIKTTNKIIKLLRFIINKIKINNKAKFNHNHKKENRKS
jgi:hypothetical protein